MKKKEGEAGGEMGIDGYALWRGDVRWDEMGFRRGV